MMSVEDAAVWLLRAFSVCLCNREETAKPGQVVVHANELEYGQEGVSTGGLVRCIFLFTLCHRMSYHKGRRPSQGTRPCRKIRT